MKTTAIVLAAGKGSRMHSNIQKQYMELMGKPVLYYSIKAFEESSADEIIIVTGANEEGFCKKHIVDKYNFKKVVKIVEGGSERYESVYNGLCLIEDSGIVAVHDSARPLIDTETIDKSIECAKLHGACVVGVPVKDTIKVVDNNTVTDTPPRSALWTAQTPQTFRYEIIKKAYDRMNAIGKAQKNNAMTDDAMIVNEYADMPAVMTEGTYRNIKITTPEDIVIAEALVQTQAGLCN